MRISDPDNNIIYDSKVGYFLKYAGGALTGSSLILEIANLLRDYESTDAKKYIIGAGVGLCAASVGYLIHKQERDEEQVYDARDINYKINELEEKIDKNKTIDTIVDQ